MKKNIDSIYKSGLSSNESSSLPQGIWEAIEKDQDKKREKKRRGFFWWTFGGISIVALGFLMFDFGQEEIVTSPAQVQNENVKLESQNVIETFPVISDSDESILKVSDDLRPSFGEDSKKSVGTTDENVNTNVIFDNKVKNRNDTKNKQSEKNRNEVISSLSNEQVANSKPQNIYIYQTDTIYIDTVIQH